MFFIVGKTDFNNKEVIDKVLPMVRGRGTETELIVHPGGHTWGRGEDHQAAMKWLEENWQRKR